MCISIIRQSIIGTSSVLYYTRKEVTNNSRRNVSLSFERYAMRVAKRKFFIFDDIRPDASDKFCSPICRLEGLLHRQHIFQDRSSLVIHPARVIPYLCPDDFFTRSVATSQSFRIVSDSGTISSWHGSVITLSGHRA